MSDQPVFQNFCCCQSQQQVRQNQSQNSTQDQPIQVYDQGATFMDYNQCNSNGNNNNQQIPYIMGNLHTIHNNHYLNIPDYGNTYQGTRSNEDGFLMLKISQSMSMLKDCIIKMNQQYSELEQDFNR